MKYLLLIPSFFLIFLMGCENQFDVDVALIENYIQENNLQAEVTDEGVYYVIEKAGTGVKPDLGSKVTVHYRGYLLDGTQFDSSYDRGEKSQFNLSGVIDGWQIGMQEFREGGAGKILIPSTLGYGRRGSGANIPGNSVLIFDIELFDVQ